MELRRGGRAGVTVDGFNGWVVSLGRISNFELGKEAPFLALFPFCPVLDCFSFSGDFAGGFLESLWVALLVWFGASEHKDLYTNLTKIHSISFHKIIRTDGARYENSEFVIYIFFK